MICFAVSELDWDFAYGGFKKSLAVAEQPTISASGQADWKPTPLLGLQTGKGPHIKQSMNGLVIALCLLHVAYYRTRVRARVAQEREAMKHEEKQTPPLCSMQEAVHTL